MCVCGGVVIGFDGWLNATQKPHGAARSQQSGVAVWRNSYWSVIICESYSDENEDEGLSVEYIWTATTKVRW